MPTPQCITMSLALAEARHLRSSTHCSRMPSAVPRHPAWISAIAPLCGMVRYTGIQSATVTVSSTPRSPVACPSMPSRMSQPSGSDSCQCTSVPCTRCARRVTGKRAPNAARNARHRPITWPTGSSLHSPRLSGRVVIPATTPYRSAHSANSSRGTAASPAGTSAQEETGAACCAPTSFAPALSAPLNLRPQRFQPVVDVLVTPFDLPDVVDHRIALGREGGAGGGGGAAALLPRQNNHFSPGGAGPPPGRSDREGGGPKTAPAPPVDLNPPAGARGQSDDRADLDVIGADGVRRSRERR